MKEISILSNTHEYIQTLSDSESGCLLADIEAMQAGDFESVHTKKLRGKIYELIMGSHRFLYFEYKNTLFFTNAFRKKTNKTPKREIDYAEKIFKIMQ